MLHPRIIMVHASPHSMQAIMAAFASEWPDADACNILDDSLYADVSPEGVVAPKVPERVLSIFKHCELSGAQGIIFTGSTFGPVVDAARDKIAIPVLKPDEAMAMEAIARGKRIALLCTARRALPVIAGNIESAASTAGTTVTIERHWVEHAQDALRKGDRAAHDRLIVDAAERVANVDLIVIGQLSMVPAVDSIAGELAAKILSGASSAVRQMRRTIEDESHQGVRV